MKVHLLKKCQPICYNLEKWDTNHLPLLLITGLSGSGKTTFAQEFAKHHHAICVSFDVLKFYPESSEQSRAMLNLFLRKYPKIKKNISIQWTKTDNANSNDILFNYYCNLFFDFLVEYSIRSKEKIVLEGIQLFVRLHPSRSVNLPIIIIRNSSFYSFCNKIKRDYYCKNILLYKDLRPIKNVINDIYIYYIKQRRILNTYIKYISILNKNAAGG